MLSRIVLLCVAAGALTTAGCGGAAEQDGTVVAAFYPLAYAAEQVASAETQVRDLTPLGAEPHDLELSARDIERLRAASLVVYASGGFQPAVEDAVEDRAGESLDVLDFHGHGSDYFDFHVWLDPQLYATVVRDIAEALGRPRAADPLVERLEALDREFERGLARCDRREIVTSHDAFAVLASRYRLRQIPLVGLSPEAEPSAGELARLVERVREAGATTVFVEPLVSPRLAETVAREAGATTAVLNPIEGLTSEQADAGADYFDLMRENLAALRRALECR